jgi:hypothetical protein
MNMIPALGALLLSRSRETARAVAVPSARVRAALEGTEVRACFLGHGSFTINLAEYRGPKPQHHGSAREELCEAAAWIQRRSIQLRAECADAAVLCIGEGEVGFRAAMVEARRTLLERG